MLQDLFILFSVVVSRLTIVGRYLPSLGMSPTLTSVAAASNKEIRHRAAGINVLSASMLLNGRELLVDYES